jgi:hypothetical protein
MKNQMFCTRSGHELIVEISDELAGHVGAAAAISREVWGPIIKGRSTSLVASPYAVAVFATSCRPRASISNSRILYF